MTPLTVQVHATAKHRTLLRRGFSSPDLNSREDKKLAFGSKYKKETITFSQVSDTSTLSSSVTLHYFSLLSIVKHGAGCL